MSQNGKILVVEDNDFVRMQIVNHLKSGAFDTIDVPDADQAISIVEKDPSIDMAVVDIRMEPKGGFDFIKTIRSIDIMTPVILVTGDQTPDLLEQAGKLGVSAVLMKPVEKDRLIKTVTRTIANHRRR